MIRLKQLLFLLSVTCGFILVFNGRAQAQATYTGETHSPSSARSTCDTGVPADFAAYIQDVSLNASTGIISYTVGLGWRGCPGGASTRAFAVYSSEKLCPLSGWYGIGNTIAYDCVKYVGNPAYDGPNRLTCAWGNNEQCVTSAFGVVRRFENQPGGGLAIIPMQYQIPKWADAQISSGSFTVSDNMCEFFKTGNDFSINNTSQRCMPLSLTVSWTSPPNWDVGVDVFCNIDSGTVTYSFSKTGIINGSVTVVKSAKLNNPLSQILSNQQSTYDNSNWPTTPIVIQLNPSIGQTMDASISVSPGGEGVSNNTSNNSVVCPTTRARTAKPYFRVYGNDVVVGRQFMSSGTCGSKKNSGIDAFNSGSGSDYQGAGVQFAASATNAINGFMSASMHSNTGASSLPESGLTFSNNDTNNIGFDSLGYTGCVGDYEQLANKLGGFSSMPTNPTDIINSSGKLIVNGDLTIDKNINSPNTAYTKLEDIKSNLVIVKGNIYIDASVNKIDGLFIAIPDGAGNGGIINTCGSSDTPNASCNNDLTVTGAFIAKKVLFNRLKGDLANAVPNEVDTSDKIAEKFIFTPDFYLGLINYLPNNDSVIGSNKYDSIVGLPPVL